MKERKLHFFNSIIVPHHTGRLESSKGKCLRMGLVCPCGTVPEQEESDPCKTKSAGVSTLQHKDEQHRRSHQRKRGRHSPTNKPLVASCDSIESFRKYDGTGQPQSIGISCTPTDIKKVIHAKQRTSVKGDEQRRSRSSSQHGKVEEARPRKHNHRHHSAEGASGHRKLIQGQYGGTNVTKISNKKVLTNSKTSSPMQKQSSKEEKCKQLTKKERISQKPMSENTLVGNVNDNEVHLNHEKKPSTGKQKKHRKPRSTTPSYVIPMTLTNRITIGGR